MTSKTSNATKVAFTAAAAFALAIAAPAVASADEEENKAPVCIGMEDVFTGETLVWNINDNDSCSDEDGDDLTVTGVSSVVGDGSASFDATSVSYTGDVTASDGSASFVATVSDGKATAEWSFSVIYDLPKEGPDAIGDEFTVKTGDTLTGNVTANDLRADGAEVLLGTDVNSGKLVLEADGTFTYTSDAGFEGVDTFSYKLDSEDGVDEASVTITVNGTGGGGGDGNNNGGGGAKDDKKDSLANTGTSLTGIALFGGATVALGAGVVWFARRRRGTAGTTD